MVNALVLALTGTERWDGSLRYPSDPYRDACGIAPTEQIGRPGIDPARGIERLTIVDGVTDRARDAASSIRD